MAFEVFDYTKYLECSIYEHNIYLNRAAYEALLADNDAALHVDLLFDRESCTVGIRRSKPGANIYKVYVKRTGAKIEECLIHAEDFLDFYKLGEEGDISAVMSDGILSFPAPLATDEQ